MMQYISDISSFRRSGESNVGSHIADYYLDSKGSLWYGKHNTSYLGIYRELLAYHFGRILDVNVPENVIAKGENERVSMSKIVRGKHYKEYPHYADNRSFFRIGFLNVILGNVDNHSRNIILGEDNQWYAFDWSYQTFENSSFFFNKEYGPHNLVGIPTDYHEERVLFKQLLVEKRRELYQIAENLEKLLTEEFKIGMELLEDVRKLEKSVDAYIEL